MTPLAESDKYSLGDQSAEEVYNDLAKNGRQQVIDLGRTLAELTIPSVFPPDNYKTGDPLPGNNQSMGGYAVSTLASELMFMAFPPGQPIARFTPNETKLQAEIDLDPELYSRVQLGLSRLEVLHREALALTSIASTYNHYLCALIVVGNALWKHVKRDSPTFHLPDKYVVLRANDGTPILSILKCPTALATLPKDVQDQIYENDETLRESEVPEFLRSADIYSVCKLKVADNGERTWCYWEEHKGQRIEGSEVETDWDDCPQWPGWMVPVYGQNWGQSYCERYRGDLFLLETHGSALNDLTALAAWALIFAKPGARTSLKQLQKAKNLDMLSGSAEDVTVFRSEKGADGNFVLASFDRAARRVGAAFLVQSAVMRDGERVTKEEVQRVGRQLDRAMGGLYTEVSQSSQRRIITRAIRLNEEELDYLPPLPSDKVTVNVITGVDAMGQSNDADKLMQFGTSLGQIFGPAAVAEGLTFSDFSNRLAAALGIKPDGLVRKKEEVADERQRNQQQMMSADLMSKAAGPAAGAMASALMDQQQQQSPTPEGADAGSIAQ